jgi:hypothetical protein
MPPGPSGLLMSPTYDTGPTPEAGHGDHRRGPDRGRPGSLAGPASCPGPGPESDPGSGRPATSGHGQPERPDQSSPDLANPFHDHPHDHDPADARSIFGQGHLAWHADHPGQGHLHVHGRALGTSAHHHRPRPDLDHPVTWASVYVYLDTLHDDPERAAALDYWSRR